MNDEKYSFNDEQDAGEIRFYVKPPKNIQEATGSDTSKEILRLCPNGDIYVNGKLAETDKKAVDGMRDLLSKAHEE